MAFLQRTGSFNCSSDEVPMALNFAKDPESAIRKAVKELATSGINVGRPVKDLKSMANAKRQPQKLKIIIY